MSEPPSSPAPPPSLPEGREPSEDRAPLLSLRRVSKRFPGVRALQEVDFEVLPGEVHALVGENGAGKSTLIKVITGVHRADGGDITFQGRPFAPRSPHEAQARGVATIHQEVNVLPDLSAAENLFLGRQPRRGPWLDRRRMHREATASLRAFGLDAAADHRAAIDVRQPIGTLPLALQQMVAIARAMQQDARLLVLDEPTSSLDRGEVEALFTVVRRLRAAGKGLVFVSHFLEQVYAVADRVTVLRDGRRVGTWRTAALPRRQLVAAMLGHAPTTVATPARSAAAGPAITGSTAGEVLLQATGLERASVVGPIDLVVRAGEVLGLAGLLGSGRSALVRLLFGADRATAGTLHWRGAALRLRSPRDAVHRGIAFCPEDRKAEGLFPTLSMRENLVLVLTAQRSWSRVRLARRRRQREIAEEWRRRLRIATVSVEQPLGLASGGNQQKVILARWLAAAPALLIQDEPTRGIDLGAKEELQALTAALAAAGTGVVFVSSELEEVVRTCDRVAVLAAGRMVALLQRDELTAQRVVVAMADAGAGT